MICAKCGQDHAAAYNRKDGSTPCAAHKRSGAPCGQPAELQQSKCHYHGAKSPNAIAKADDRKATIKAERRMAAMIVSMEGLPTFQDPKDIVMHLLRISQLAERAYALMLSEDHDATVTVEVDYGAGGIRREQHAVLALWDKERDRLGKLATEAVKCGIAERAVQVQEQQAAEFIGILARGLMSSGLTPTDRQRVHKAVADQMRLMGSGVVDAVANAPQS